MTDQTNHDAVRVVDLNADLGEGFGIWQLGDDNALLDVITSANVACGFHAGDPLTMRRVCEQAASRGVAIGAQVGYRDLAGFGRRRIDVAHDELAADVLYQMGALAAAAIAAGARLRYVKPHGALYNTAADDPGQADAVAEAIAAYDRSLPLLGLPNSAMAAAAADHGLTFVAEGFADRAYLASGRLMSRREPNAVHTDTQQTSNQAMLLAAGRVVTADGVELPMPIRSLCIHGDTPGAVEHARAVRAVLVDGGVRLSSFA
jgi:UPF0271 protein